MPQNLLIRALSETEDAKQRNKMKANWEGSSDKYARMTAGWLQKIGLIEQVPKTVSIKIASTEYSQTVEQS